jgi:hypothetical protein
VERWIAHASIPANLIVFAAVKEQEQVAGIHSQEIDHPLWSPFGMWRRLCSVGYEAAGLGQRPEHPEPHAPS